MSISFNFYYLYKYGGGSGLTADRHGFFSSATDDKGPLLTNNFLGGLLQYNRFDTTQVMQFVLDKTKEENTANTFDEFNSSYKSIIGSDIMSHLNKYTNTTDMALGDMVNQKDTATNKAYADSLTANDATFYFHQTKDGDLYRYTSSNGMVGAKDITSDGKIDFDDLYSAYDAYKDYKLAQLEGKSTPDITSVKDAINLADSNLGISWAQISAITTSALGRAALYQNIVDQIIDESLALKGSTISEKDLITMERALESTQSGLMALDDAIYGHGYNAVTLDMSTKIDDYTMDNLGAYREMKTTTPTDRWFQDNTSVPGYDPSTDTNSLVFQLAKSLLDGGEGFYAPTGATEAQKMAFTGYISEITASLMERYWTENFNNGNAETIDEYFAREFRNIFAPQGASYDKIAVVDRDLVSYGVGWQTFGAGFELDLNKDPAKNNIIDIIMEKQSWAQLFSKVEDRSRTEVELFEKATALDVVANINNKDFEYRMALLGQLEKLSAAQTLNLDFSRVTKNLITLGPGEQKNPWWQEYFPWFKGYYGNLPEGATPDQMFDENGHLTMKFSAPGSPLIDPYLVKINGVDYVMGKDDDKDGNISNAQEILGITDTIKTTFASLKALDTDKNGIVSQEELKAQNIIFKAVNESERMNGAEFDTSLINNIDLSTLVEADGTNNIYGFFNVKLKNGQTAAAVQTFENQSYFNNLFGKYADMSFLTGSTSSSTSNTSANTTSTSTAKNKAKEIAEKFANSQKTAAKSSTMENTAKSGFNFFSYLDNKDEATTKELLPIKDDKKTIVINSETVSLEDLFDDICWKSSIYNLSTKSRYEILDSIDETLPPELIIKKMETEVQQYQKGFSA